MSSLFRPSIETSIDPYPYPELYVSMEGSIQKDYPPSPNRDQCVDLEERLGRKTQELEELEHRMELLMADNEAFKQERVVLKQEILQLHDEMELARTQVVMCVCIV